LNRLGVAHLISVSLKRQTDGLTRPKQNCFSSSGV